MRNLPYKGTATSFNKLERGKVLLVTPNFRFLPDACGGMIDSANGTITSPSFPDLYPVNKNCIWEIIAPPQYRITLNFTHFDLEGNNVSKLNQGFEFCK